MLRIFFDECFDMICLQVRYKPTSGSAVVQLTIPMEAALNGREYKEYQDRKRAKTTPDGDAPAPVVARVPFEACLERLVRGTFF